MFFIRKKTEYELKDKELEDFFKLQCGFGLTDMMAGLHSDLDYYFIDKDTIKVKVELTEKALYAMWKRADKDFVKLCGYSTFSEFFDKEGFYQVVSSKSEINNMDNYIIAHVLPDEPYQVRFEDTLHLRVNANKRHNCVEAKVKLSEKELGNEYTGLDNFSRKSFGGTYNGSKDIRNEDENTGRGWFEEIETTAAFLNSFAAIEAYINGEYYKPVDPYSPTYHHDVRQYNKYFERYEVGIRPEATSDFHHGDTPNKEKWIAESRPEATLFFIRESDGLMYSLVKPYSRENIEFFPTYGTVQEKACEEITYRKANILLEALLNKQPCIQDSDFCYMYRKDWTPDRVERNRVGVDFAFDRIETIDGNSIKIDDLPPLKELASGKAFTKNKNKELYEMSMK